MKYYICSQDLTCTDEECQGHSPSDKESTWGGINILNPYDCKHRLNRDVKGVYPVEAKTKKEIKLPEDLFIL